MFIRAGSVLTETEEPTVFDDFLRTETEIEPVPWYFSNPKPGKNRNNKSTENRKEPKPKMKTAGTRYQSINVSWIVYSAKNALAAVLSALYCSKLAKNGHFSSPLPPIVLDFFQFPYPQ